MPDLKTKHERKIAAEVFNVAAFPVNAGFFMLRLAKQKDRN